MGGARYYIALEGLPKRKKDSVLYWDLRKAITKRYEKAISTFLHADGEIAIVLYDNEAAMKEESKKVAWTYTWGSITYAVRGVPQPDLVTIGVIKVYGDDIDIRTVSDSLNLPPWPFVVIYRNYGCLYINFTQLVLPIYNRMKAESHIDILGTDYRTTAEDKATSPTNFGFKLYLDPKKLTSNGNGKVSQPINSIAVASVAKPTPLNWSKITTAVTVKPDPIEVATVEDKSARVPDELETKLKLLRTDYDALELRLKSMEVSLNSERQQKRDLEVQTDLYKRLLHESQTYRFKMEADLNNLRQTLVARALLEDVVKRLKEKCLKKTDSGCREALKCDCGNCRRTLETVEMKLKASKNIVATFSIDTLRKTLSYAYERFSKVAHPTEKKPIVPDIHSDHHVELALIGCALLVEWPLET